LRWRALPAFAAIDFLSCLLVVFVAVAVASRPPQVRTYGTYAVVITWPKAANDVDLHLRDPAGAICNFLHLQVDQMQLEHDDLGTKGTNYGAGKPNQERIVLRGTMTGEYVANVQMYYRGAGVGPVPVVASLWDLRGDDRVLKTRTMYLSRTGDQKTAFRFTMNPSGSVAGYSYVPVSLTQPTTSYESS
jgi:hypothetical protein